MTRCTAPVQGHRTASGRAACPACGGRYGYSPSSYGGRGYEPWDTDSERSSLGGHDLTAIEIAQVDQAVSLVADTIADGWAATAAARAADLVSDRCWQRMFGSPNPRNCRVLARLAAAVLAGQSRLYQECGVVAEAIAAGAGLGAVPRRFARELGTRLPMLVDAPASATARGLQVTGIVLCLDAGRSLRECRCFVDMAVALSQEQLEQVLTEAIRDWTQLA